MFNTDWAQLKIFLLVARSQSFNAAAQTMSVSHATISRHISALENELGVTLFHRTPQGIVLTQAADSILRHVSAIEEKVKLIEATAAQEMALSGKIRLSVGEGIGGYWLPPRMKEFHRRYPGVTVDILCSQQPLDIGTMEADLVVSWQEPDHPDAILLCDSVMTLKPCASVEYLEAYGVPETLDDLRNHRLCDYISFPTDGAWKVWADIVADSPNVCYRTNSSLALGEATKNGLGISLQPIGLQYRESTLKLLDIEGIAPSLRFWLSCHKSVKDIPRIRALINHIKSDIFLNPVPGSAFYSDI